MTLEFALQENPEDEPGIQAKSEELAKAVATLIGQQSIHQSRLLRILTIVQREKLNEMRPGEAPFEGPEIHRRIPPHPGPRKHESNDDPASDPDFD